MRIALTIVCLLVASITHAEVKPHALFSENAVLQQQVEVPVWGTAANGEKVTVEIQDQKVSTTAKDGQWMLRLRPLKAGGPFTMKFIGANTITLTNILVGEVWICSGQSNMEWPLRASFQSQNDVETANNPQLRLFTVPKLKAPQPLDDVKGMWEVSPP